MKLCVFFIFKLCPWLVQIGDWALKWTEGDERLQVFFVMLFFPLVMNALQYYIIDSFIKDKKPADHESVPSEESEEGEGGRLRRSQESRRSDSIDGDDEIDAVKDRATVRTTGGSPDPAISDKTPAEQMQRQKIDDYDPMVDGEASSSSHGSGTPRDQPISQGKEDEIGSQR